MASSLIDTFLIGLGIVLIVIPEPTTTVTGIAIVAMAADDLIGQK